MSSTTAERIRAIKSASRWAPWEAACFFAGDYFGRIPSRHPYTEYATATLRQGADWSNRLRMALATIHDALHIAGNGPYTQVGAVLCADERHVYLGDFKAYDYTFQAFQHPEAPRTAALQRAMFERGKYAELFALARAYNGRELSTVSALSETSPLFNDEALEGIGALPDEIAKRLAEEIERVLYDDFWAKYPSDPDAFSPQEIAERKRQKESGSLFSTWPPAPLERDRFPTLCGIVPGAMNATETAPDAPTDTPVGEVIPLAKEIAPGVTVRDVVEMLDPTAQNYSQLLAFAIEVRADIMRNPLPRNRGVKDAIEKRAQKIYEQTNKPDAWGKEELSTIQRTSLAYVLNWNQKGGAPKSENN